MKSRIFGSLVIVVLLLASCATIFKGSTQKVNFGSDPSGAKVYINGQLMGTTPFELGLQSKHSYTIEFRKEGFQNKTVLITNSIGAGWIILDVLLGLIPVIVDAATGDWMYLDQTNVNAALEAQQ
jgi:hypothetical protein